MKFRFMRERGGGDVIFKGFFSSFPREGRRLHA